MPMRIELITPEITGIVRVMVMVSPSISVL